jgi:hypothetical protein
LDFNANVDFTTEIANLTQSPDWETTDPHKLYLQLYKKVTAFDKHIARRYDGFGGSRYFQTVYNLFYDKVLTTDDIARFDDEVQTKIKNLKVLCDDDNSIE